MREKRRERGGSRGPRQPRAKRRFSQNFLIDNNISRKIVELAQIEPGDKVLEIGPGTGALTRLLVAKAPVHAVEVDRELAAALGVEFQAEPRLTIHTADVLKCRIRELIPTGPVVVLGNLPYGITSDLVLWLLDQWKDVRRAVLLMQKEVAERLTAAPGERKGGRMTLAVQYRMEVERILEVAPDSFRPIPRVTSSLVAFRPRAETPVHPQDEALFFRVIRAAFGERRKTLANALSVGLKQPRSIMEHAARDAGLDPQVRGERLTLEEFCKLADLLGQHLGPTEGQPEETSDEPANPPENNEA